ncbi:MAG TPA: carbonic anhydrase, partial [Methanocella sp.]|nr:carbonic anhydrase [Methanocella sp.]
ETLTGKLTYNKRYSDEATSSGRYQPIVDGQHPDVTLVTCSDSRVLERALDDQIGKIFSIRNIGNRVEPNLGSIVYGVGHLHTPVLMIMGHTGCGAIHASTLELKDEHARILKSLDFIKPTVAEVQKLLIRKGGLKAYRKGSKAVPATDVGDEAYFETLVTEANVDRQIENLLSDASIRDMVYADKLMIVGAIYDFKDIYSKKKGAIYVVNVNGETGPERLKKLAIAGGNGRIVAGKIKRMLVY